MRRRDLILSSLAAVLAAKGGHAQPVKTLRIGIINGLAADDPEAAPRIAAFAQSLESFGWKVGRDVQIEPRWSGGSMELLRAHAAELVALAPDVIVSVSDPALAELRRLTRTIPVIFLIVADPVGNGFVQSLARPGGNLTGFSNAEPALAGKWIELLREIAPAVRRLNVLLHPDSVSTVSFGRAIATAAAAVGLPIRRVEIRARDDIDPALRDSAGADAGIVVLPSIVTSSNGSLIAARAAMLNMPAIYPFTGHVAQGGLISYGINITEVWRQTPWYVDRILRGAEPGELPVQQPTSFELAVNLNTARALGLAVPGGLLSRADRVIE